MMEWINAGECLPPIEVEVLALSKKRCFVAVRISDRHPLLYKNKKTFIPSICTCCEEEDDWDIIWWRYLPKKPGENK